jgi:folate-binding protein YgfZ
VIPSTLALAGVVDLSRRGKLRVTGADRVRFLNGQVSNEVRRVSQAASIYTCVMTIKGKMCADAFIHATGDALWLDAEPEVRESLAARLEKYIIADDVTLEDVSDDLSLLHLVPLPADAVEDAVPAAWAQSLAAFRCIRSWRYGQPGLDLFGSPAAIGEARGHLLAANPFFDAGSLDLLRILAGVPKWGAELDENTMPAEAGLEERAVSYDKGCYIGQEVVSRVKSVGHVNRHLRGLRSSGGGGGLAPGWSLYPAEAAPGSREVGRVTSVAPDPADERATIALAFVRRGWESAGNVLAARPAPSTDSAPGDHAPAGLDLPREECRVVVCELPFI